MAVTVLVVFDGGKGFGVGVEGALGGKRSRVGSIGSSGNGAISETSTRGVATAGSVPRKMKSNGVGLGVMGACGGELRERPISKATIIPITEIPPMTIGIMKSH
jgi:hypothetical protein